MDRRTTESAGSAPGGRSGEETERAGWADWDARGMAVAWTAAIAPDRAAVLCDQGRRSFAELNARCNQLARALRERGLRGGDAIALSCTNRPEFIEVVFAAQRAGLRLTPINWHLSAEETAYIVENCGARAFVADAELGPVPAQAAQRAEAGVRLAVGGRIDGFEAYDAALAPQDPGDLTDPEPGSSMLYTSGTTGRPKGVYRSERPNVPERHRYRPESDRALVTGPLYHAAPLKQASDAVRLGVGVVLMRRFDAEETLHLIETHRITHTHLVPTMFHRLLLLPQEVRERYDTSSLRAVVHGAAPCPVHLKHSMIEWLGPIVSEYYAATEGAGTWVSSREWLSKPGTVGRAVLPDGIVIGDEDGNPLPPRTEGLVFLRAPSRGRFRYYGDDTKTDASYRGDYFTLGDVGYLDEDGYLFLTDRSAHLIISGGVNIYPAEVDAVLLRHPAVGDAAVIGVPNEEWGEEVKAVVELRPEIAPSPALAEELIAFCRERIAHYKCPRSVDFVDELPRTDAGKIYKRRLRERYR